MQKKTVSCKKKDHIKIKVVICKQYVWFDIQFEIYVSVYNFVKTKPTFCKIIVYES